MKPLSLAISGMSCGHCVAAVRRALTGLDGVRVDDVSIGAARVEFDPARLSPNAILEAVNDEGYVASVAGGE